MPSPFPGMDPYLEDPALWSGFHVAFLAAMQERLGPLVRPKYFVRIEERVYVASDEDPAYHLISPDLRVVSPRHAWSGSVAVSSGAAVAEPIPVVEVIDPEVHEHRLEVIDRLDRSVVTVIELLSPTNKVPGSVGRLSFLQKRREVYASKAHWIEIDFLRQGTRTMNPAESAGSAYQIYLSRSGERRKGLVWPVPLRQRLPRIGIPLGVGDPNVPLDLQESFDAVYDRRGYHLDIDYRLEPASPLALDDAEWARGLIGST